MSLDSGRPAAAIPSGWQQTTLGQFVALQRGFDLPTRVRKPGPFPVLSSGGYSGTHSEGPIPGPGLVIGRATNLGVPTWSDGNFWPLNTTLFVKDFRGNDPRFVYYVFTSLDLAGYNSGSVQPMLNRNYVANVPLIVPTSVEQRAISATLRALDDKIQSNRQVQATALHLAEALYMDACARAGDKLKLSDAGTWLSGGTPSTKRADFWGGVTPWISSSSLKSVFLFDSDRRLTERGAAEATHVVPRGAVLIVVRGMSLLSEFRVGVAQRPMAFGQDCKAILPSVPSALLVTALLATRSRILGLVDQAGHGTGRLSSDRLLDLEVLMPRDSSIMEEIEDLFGVAGHRSLENQRLTQLRSALLPELMFGRIRVAEATETLAEVL